MSSQNLTFYEFFAGGGMVRAGLGKNWQCLFANDIDAKKGASYLANWGDEHLKISDVSDLTVSDMPGHPGLAWASFPCQDLSLAGNGKGLRGKRSGTFWPFWRLIKELRRVQRAPKVIVLENVCGTLSSHGGKDFAAIGAAIAREKYRFGALVIDAALFVPQSRPRLFIVCAQEGTSLSDSLTADAPNPLWHPPHLATAQAKLPPQPESAWIWWRLPSPAPRATTLSNLIETEPQNVSWHTPDETRYLLSLMSPLNRRKVELAQRMGRPVVGCIYRRTRRNEEGHPMQRAEVRFDDISGCLRTPVGGSSRQSIIIVNGKKVHSRLLSPREAARLMGLEDDYILPQRYNEAYHLAGDGVVVPVVRFLAANIIEPLLDAAESREQEAA